MSVVKVASIFCDGTEGNGPCSAWCGEGNTSSEARAQARGKGWVRTDGRDLCPACQVRARGEVPCSTCGGAGKLFGFIDDTCPTCGGTGAEP